MSAPHRTTGATCYQGCPLMLFAHEAAGDPGNPRRADINARTALAQATGLAADRLGITLLDRAQARRYYRGINLTLFRQGCAHKPIRTRT